MICDSCGKDRPCTEDVTGDWICQSCVDNQNEAAWEREQEKIMEGDGPLSLDEQCRIAWEEHRKLHR